MIGENWAGWRVAAWIISAGWFVIAFAHTNWFLVAGAGLYTAFLVFGMVLPSLHSRSGQNEAEGKPR